MGVIGGAEQAQWEEEGWCLVQGLLPAEAVAAARAALAGAVPDGGGVRGRHGPGTQSSPFASTRTG